MKKVHNYKGKICSRPVHKKRIFFKQLTYISEEIANNS